MNLWTRIVRQNRLSLQIFLYISLLLLALGPGSQYSKAEPKLTFLPEVEQKIGRGMLWKVTTPDGRVNHLFGTIHVEDASVTNLARPVSKAFRRSQSLSLELIPDQQTLLQTSQLMLFTDGRSLEQVAGKDLYERSVAAMRSRGMPEAVVRQMKPWAVMTSLSVPKSKTGKFLDFRLYERAKQYNKKIYALESYAEQLSVFNTMPMDEQVKMLRDTLGELNNLPIYFTRLKRAWLARDLEKLQALSDEQLPPDDPANQKLMERLIDDRNRKMFERMQPRLAEGNAFIAVGALHLPGKSGLIKMLRDDGHKVEAVW